jgi:hypothetical protein
MKMILFFFVMTLCNLVGCYQGYRGTYRLHLPFNPYFSPYYIQAHNKRRVLEEKSMGSLQLFPISFQKVQRDASD